MFVMCKTKDNLLTYLTTSPVYTVSCHFNNKYVLLTDCKLQFFNEFSA